MFPRFDSLPPSEDSDAVRTARELRERPGEQAHISDHPTPAAAANFAYRIRTGAHTAFRPAGHYQAESHATPTGGGVWAKYVGGPEAR
ncbi:hypothetical protein ACN20G_33630 (plasmid) [Streptomyces sp. BI20]|uniref:hypothetical protein n=1 Tax=Streptomyces sp. BI20 TaxID=3403460 RepID=UPI003C707D79